MVISNQSAPPRGSSVTEQKGRRAQPQRPCLTLGLYHQPAAPPAAAAAAATAAAGAFCVWRNRGQTAWPRKEVK